MCCFGFPKKLSKHNINELPCFEISNCCIIQYLEGKYNMMGGQFNTKFYINS